MSAFPLAVRLGPLLRFAAAGCAGFVADFATLLLLREGLQQPLGRATAAGFLLGGGVNYCLSRFWVFAPTGSTSEIRRVSSYVALFAFNLGFTVVFVTIASHAGVDYRVAKPVCVMILLCFNYVLMKRVIMSTVVGAARQFESVKRRGSLFSMVRMIRGEGPRVAQGSAVAAGNGAGLHYCGGETGQSGGGGRRRV